MNTILYFFGSGLAFFAGALLLIVCVVLLSLIERPRLRAGITLLALLAWVFVVLSAVPLPWYFLALALLLMFLWIVAERSRRRFWISKRRWLRIGVVVITAAVVTVETPCLYAPTVPRGNSNVYVIGDSLSAGIGGRDERTWPMLLAHDLQCEVQNFASPGATAVSAMRQTEKLPDGGLVIIEIGGNDLLGDTTSLQFERDLDALLKTVMNGNRRAVMFELPLPPFQNEFGSIQRKLAVRYGVPLIPKRVLMGVLATEGGTSDGLHLTDRGHRLMADALREILG